MSQAIHIMGQAAPIGFVGQPGHTTYSSVDTDEGFIECPVDVEAELATICGFPVSMDITFNSINDVISELQTAARYSEDSSAVFVRVIQEQQRQIEELQESIRQTDENIAGLELGL